MHGMHALPIKAARAYAGAVRAKKSFQENMHTKWMQKRPSPRVTKSTTLNSEPRRWAKAAKGHVGHAFSRWLARILAEPLRTLPLHSIPGLIPVDFGCGRGQRRQLTGLNIFAYKNPLFFNTQVQISSSSQDQLYQPKSLKI